MNAFRGLSRKFSPALIFLSKTRLDGALAANIKRNVGFDNSFSVDYVGVVEACCYCGWMIGMLLYSLSLKAILMLRWFLHVALSEDLRTFMVILVGRIGHFHGILLDV